MAGKKNKTNQNSYKAEVLHSVRTKILGAMVLAMVILSVCLSVVLIRNLRIPLMEINKVNCMIWQLPMAQMWISL